MAAPSGIVWGSTVNDYGRIGIYVKLTSTATETTRHTEIWFWSKYSVSDTSNTFYYDDNETSATTSKGSVSIKTSSDSGGWSTSNQIKLKEYDYTFTRGTSASKRNVAAKLSGVDRVGGTMSVTTSYTIPALTKYTITYNANGGSDAPSSQTKYYGKTLTLSTVKPTRTGYAFQGWGTSSSDTSVDYDPGDSYKANANITLYAIWKINTYTVSYNPNGGSDAPSNQTKTYGKTLTLSDTIPTRTGYTFQGWGSSASDTSVDYAAGGSYTANAKTTLYAIWKINTYTVSYNANGGSGAPSSQTKTHGTALPLSSTEPTRTDYNFKGWATSSTSDTVSYSPGDVYTSNSKITLYAVWELAYVAPRITNLSVDRCNQDGSPDDSGTCFKMEFDWTTDKNISDILVQWKPSGSSSWIDNQEPFTVTGTHGSIDAVLGDGMISTDFSYTIQITVLDSGGNTTIVRSISSAIFSIDVMPGDKGIAFGGTATTEGVCDIYYKTRFKGGILQPDIPHNTDLNEYITPGTYTGDNIASSNYLNYPPLLTAGTFSLNVAKEGFGTQIKQTISICSKDDSSIWERSYYGGTWGDWHHVMSYKGRLLWSGSNYMHADQSIDLPEQVSLQANGIVLVFSKYDTTNKTAVNSEFNSFFLSKKEIASTLGCSHSFFITTGFGGTVGVKCLYFSDVKITGYKNNASNTTAESGLVIKNDSFVLRYVFGV